MKLSTPKFAIINAFRRRSLAIITICIVALGISAFSATAPPLESMAEQTKTKLTAFGDIAIIQENKSLVDSSLPESMKQEIEKIDGVKHAEPQIWLPIQFGEGKIVNGKAKAMLPGTMKIGVYKELNIKNDGFLNYIFQGRNFYENKTEAVIGTRMHAISEINIGEVLSLYGNNTRINFTVVGIYRTGNIYSDAHIIIPMKFARELSNLSKENISVFSVKLEDITKVKEVEEKIEQQIKGVEVFAPEDTLRGAMDVTLMIRNTGMAVMYFILVSCFLIVIAILYMNIKERVKEFAMLKALGWSNKDIRNCVIIECFSLSIVGGIFGVIIGIPSTALMQIYLIKFQVVEYSLFWSFFSFAISILFGIVGGSYPAIKASKVRPAIVLREG